MKTTNKTGLHFLLLIPGIKNSHGHLTDLMQVLQLLRLQVVPAGQLRYFGLVCTLDRVQPQVCLSQVKPAQSRWVLHLNLQSLSAFSLEITLLPAATLSQLNPGQALPYDGVHSKKAMPYKYRQTQYLKQYHILRLINLLHIVVLF